MQYLWEEHWPFMEEWQLFSGLLTSCQANKIRLKRMKKGSVTSKPRFQALFVMGTKAWQQPPVGGIGINSQFLWMLTHRDSPGNASNLKKKKSWLRFLFLFCFPDSVCQPILKLCVTKTHRSLFLGASERGVQHEDWFPLSSPWTVTDNREIIDYRLGRWLGWQEAGLRNMRTENLRFVCFI